MASREGPAPKKRPVGAGLSLDKFAQAGVSTYDKRKKLEKLQKESLIKHSKYSKLKRKLESSGMLPSTFNVRDSVAELETLEGRGTGDGQDEPSGRTVSHRGAGPSHRAGPPGAPHPTKGKKHKLPHQQKLGESEQEDSDAGGAAAAGRASHPAPSAGGAGAKRSHQQLTGPPGQPGSASAGAEPGSKRQKAGGEQVGALGGPQRHGRPHPSSQGKPLPGGDEEHEEAAGRLLGSDPGSDGEGEGHRGGGGGRGGARGGQQRGRGGKQPTQLHRLAMKVAEEKAARQQAKELADKERAQKQQRVASVEKARKEEKHLYFKRTAKGQPLMRYRMDKLLSKIQAGN